MTKRTVCIVTGSRADYGLLKNLITLLIGDDSFKVNIAVTGPHLSPIWGHTYKEIEKDGFTIDAKVTTLMNSDELSGMAKTLGVGIISFTDYFTFSKPDYTIVLGDRFEVLAAAQAAYCLKIPVVHLHGGEVTYGAMDDYFRHSMSKLATLHFVAHDDYKKRLIQMGEAPSSIFVCGALGIDQIKGLGKDIIEQELGLKLWDKYFLIVYHPTTAAIDDALKEQEVFKNIWLALKSYPEHQIIVSLANADPCGHSINKTWEEIAEQSSSDRLKLFYHFGSKIYLGLVSHSQAVIGNSSSGILEVPYFHKATVNIGERQEGRYHPTSVIKTSSDSKSINAAIEKAIDVNWQKINCLTVKNPFGEPGTVAKKILDVLKSTDVGSIKYKRFYDLK